MRRLTIPERPLRALVRTCLPGGAAIMTTHTTRTGEPEDYTTSEGLRRLLDRKSVV